MPIYTFGCTGCGFEADMIRGVAVEAVTCPDCSGTARRAQVNRISFAMKGEAPVSLRPQSLKDFSEASAELGYRAERAEADGRASEAPQHYKWAKQEAKRLQSLGVKDSTEVFGNAS